MNCPFCESEQEASFWVAAQCLACRRWIHRPTLPKQGTMTEDDLRNLEFKLEFGLPMAQSELNELQAKRCLLRDRTRRLLDLRTDLPKVD